MIPKMVDDSLVGLRSVGSEEDRLQALQWIENRYLEKGGTPGVNPID